MKRYLFNLVFSIVLMLVAVQAFSQVELTDRGVTKFYDDGTRITYLGMKNFPNSVEMREYVAKKVLEHPDVKRAFVKNNGTTFMYEALQSIEPDVVVDMVNDALEEYSRQFGDFPVEEKIRNSALPEYSVTEERVGDSPAGGNQNGMSKHANPVNVRPVEKVNDNNNKK